MKRALRTRPAFVAAVTIAALALSTAQASAPLQQRKPASLQVVKATFQKLDGNANKSISLSEAMKAKVSPSLFKKHDADDSRGLDTDEFVVLYKELLVRSGRPVGTDLDGEVARIQARRRAAAETRRKEAEAKRTQAARKKVADASADSRADSTAEARTKAAREQQDAATAEARTTAAREKQAAGSAEARTKTAREKQATLDAQRIEEARRMQADLDEQRTREARETQAALTEQRVREAREKQSAQSAEARTKAARQKAAKAQQDDATVKRTAASQKTVLPANSKPGAKKGNGAQGQAKPQKVGNVKSAKRVVKPASVTRPGAAKPQARTPAKTRAKTPAKTTRSPAKTPVKAGATPQKKSGAKKASGKGV